MNVLLISPGFPADMPQFTRGLARIGANVLGVGDQGRASLDPDAAEALTAYLQVPDLWSEEDVVRRVREWLGGRTIDRLECLWEPGVVLAARLREAFELPGLTVRQAVPFRDKESMKQVLDAAGIRTPHHYRARTKDECREAAERVGYPLIIKPISGAGSADTYPLREPADLDEALAKIDHIEEVSVEEFIEGEEFTFDTISANGRVLFENVAWYRPKPLTARLNAWINPQAVCLRDLDRPELQSGRELGYKVLDALGYHTGFAHMEWFRTSGGEAIFGEIGGRSPGGRLVHAMNYSCDIDLFTGWAEAVCAGSLSQDTRKRYNAAVIFKRADGPGQIVRRIEGVESLMAHYGEHVAVIDMVRVGEPRRDWRKVVTGDGWIVVRHPDLETTLQMADRFSTELRIHAE